jgi:hypothetical protein
MACKLQESALAVLLLLAAAAVQCASAAGVCVRHVSDGLLALRAFLLLLVLNPW